MTAADFAAAVTAAGTTSTLRRRTGVCPAALNIRGEHFACDWPTDPDGTHRGWAHTNKEAEAVWLGTASDEELSTTHVRPKTSPDAT